MLARPDDQRREELAALSKARPPALEVCIHMRLGRVEVIEKRPDRWAFRQPPSEFVEDREPNEFRPLMSREDALKLLALFEAPKPVQATDLERREKVKKIRPDKVDLRKPFTVAKQLLYFAGLVAARETLWGLEKSACKHFRGMLAEELAEVLGEPQAALEARLPG